MPGLRGKALVAYLLVCVFWGSTYLAIRVGVGVLPPLLFAGTRFFTAGVLLAGLAVLWGHRFPQDGLTWRTQAIVGLFLLAGGNTWVVWAEQFTASGVASLFVVTVALWMAFFDAIVPGGSGRLQWRVIAGLLLGLVGTALLVGATPSQLVHADLRGPIALTAASASWAFGSIYFKRHPTKASPYVAASIQMLVGGAFITLVGLLVGEAGAWHWSARGLGAITYLVVFGSIVGYSSYSYALAHAPATLVGTYAYVNPVIAVLLGAIVLHEPVTARTLFAMGLILGAVVWIQLSHGRMAGRSDSRTDSAPAQPSNRPAVRQTTG
jgi:drug/metabolite transporter (DMT)-like permease